MIYLCFVYRSLRTAIGENASRNSMVYGTSTSDEYSQSRNHYSRIPSHNALQSEMQKKYKQHYETIFRPSKHKKYFSISCSISNTLSFNVGETMQIRQAFLHQYSYLDTHLIIFVKVLCSVFKKMIPESHSTSEHNFFKNKLQFHEKIF